MAPSWSELPPELLGLVIDRLDATAPSHRRRRSGFSDVWPKIAPGHHRRHRPSFSAAWLKLLRRTIPSAAAAIDRRGFRALQHDWQSGLSADRARLRAVCRAWCVAMREHVVRSPRLLPWIVISDGSFLTSSDSGNISHHRIPTVPTNATCIGSTDDWLVLHYIDAKTKTHCTHTYTLHNAFSNKTVPLPELDAVIGNISVLFMVCKVLMRSTPCDVVALITNNNNYPLILVRPGKGVWLPQPHDEPFSYIVDIAFVGDKLYGVTQAKHLVSLSMCFDSNGRPSITGIERLIRNPPTYYSRFEVWSDDEDDENLDAKDDETGEYGFEYYERSAGEHALVESRGKLLMVTRLLHTRSDGSNIYTRKVDVFEACTSKGVWVPVSDGLGGQALFISKLYSKSISAYGDVEPDTIYFADTGETFNIISQTMSSRRWEMVCTEPTWMFSPDLVV